MCADLHASQCCDYSPRETSVIKLEGNDLIVRQYNNMILLYQRVKLIFGRKLSLETKHVGKVP